MATLQEVVEDAIEQSKKEVWGQEIPIVRAQLRLAIHSLNSQLPAFWDEKVEDVMLILKKNKGIAKILRKHSAEAIAFAIRDARL